MKEFSYLDKINKSDWIEVLSATFGQASIIQKRVGELVVKDRDWSVDFNRAVIAFGEDEFSAQFLGSESSEDMTWLWAWENINNFSENLVEIANSIHQKGIEWGLDAFSNANCAIDEEHNAHMFASAVIGLTKDKAYYSGPHAHGVALIIIEDLPKEIFEPAGILEFVHTLMYCTKAGTFSHKILLEAMLEWNNTSYYWEENTVIADFKSKNPVRFIFEITEEFCRIRNIEASLEE